MPVVRSKRMGVTAVALLAVAVCPSQGGVEAAFVPGVKLSSAPPFSSTRVYGRQLKRMNIGTELIPGASISGRRRKNAGKKNKKKDKKLKDSKSSEISPALAEWMAQGGTEEKFEAQEDDDEEDDDLVAGFQTFDEGSDDRTTTKKEKREEKRNINVLEQAQSKLVQTTVEELEALFETQTNRDLDSILGKLKELSQLEGATRGLRVLAAGENVDYRMAWVGSDDAVCHVGTGLHKVPLARLQDVFMTVGKNRVEVFEVIRILGPFPNVRNTLSGDVAMSKGQLQFSYDMMMDGLGKQLEAGTDDNVRKLKLNILFADSNAIVATVPNKDAKATDVDDLMGENGANVLLFVREPELETKLEILRVN
eukprot:CAMPEP_0198282488 /NCGR_PEP_ID=MMETSP1449-20131203/2288_1 /TAXON_ID=420275 /ORGANISM="Attheya septentrionalis, Strain CCMP2084" /LENGTH=365 /DNA_ID=CAMNT_0043978753 /DNA_START=54 /DNA_END=1151 /DNA_ORIENTATION=-